MEYVKLGRTGVADLPRLHELWRPRSGESCLEHRRGAAISGVAGASGFRHPTRLRTGVPRKRGKAAKLTVPLEHPQRSGVCRRIEARRK